MNLFITLDYELFGDGSGDVFTHIVEPTNFILEVCQKAGIRTTIFFEALEYLKIKEEWECGNTMGYSKNPIEAIEQQIQKAAKAGHDIQLHIHPQWYDAKYQNGKWRLDHNHWRLGDFVGSQNYGVKELMSDCKSALEAVVQQVKPDYKCIGLRAGGYNIMPSSKVYLAMLELGIKFDSSVYPGGYESGSLSKYNYRRVPLELDYWWGDVNDIRKVSENSQGVLEIPIFALPIPPWKRVFTYAKVKSLLLGVNNAVSANSKEKLVSKSIKEKLKYMFQPEPATWDVCMYSKSLHKSYFKYIETHLPEQRSSYVLIGHPKNLQDQSLFKSFIEVAKSRKHEYLFITLSEKYAEIVD